ncbi:tripartite-type tricarboxylate transporter receptor subunit TctC [Pseudacidovorax sp. 1753]|uniref:Bug family tripartite tricarboxylate transporter substrate binding protein n=1 Tax=Pseudacidovorax sp. 1753 TaxID=3156419 RepID=UPI003392C64C
MPLTRRAATLAPLLLTALGATRPARAAYPDKPLNFVVPFGAGSATDQLARALAVGVTEQSGQPVVVDNRAGAGGMLAAQHVARAPADGYTVLVTTNSTQTANPFLYRKLPYDPIKDFKPLTALGRGGTVLVVRQEAPYRSVADVLAHARRRPGTLTFGSGNSSSRMAGEMFKQLSGTDILWVGYKSNPNALTDLLGGQIDLMFIDTVTGLPHIQSGKLRPLGVSTPQRIAPLPQVPTIAEAGVTGYDIGYWFGAYVPAATPEPVAQRLREWLVAASASSQAKSFYANTSTEPWTTSPEDLARFQATDTQKWGRVIKAAGIEPE